MELLPVTRNPQAPGNQPTTVNRNNFTATELHPTTVKTA
jgi:hypothetical protein